MKTGFIGVVLPTTLGDRRSRRTEGLGREHAWRWRVGTCRAQLSLCAMDSGRLVGRARNTHAAPRLHADNFRRPTTTLARTSSWSQWFMMAPMRNIRLPCSGGSARR